MDEYIRKEAAVDAGYLSDWYIASVGDESPVWTDEHIEELLNDFIVFPKDISSADVQPVKHGTWRKDEQGYDVYVKCSECGLNLDTSDYIETEWRELLKYCPCCGARMDGETNG